MGLLGNGEDMDYPFTGKRAGEEATMKIAEVKAFPVGVFVYVKSLVIRRLLDLAEQERTRRGFAKV